MAYNLKNKLVVAISSRALFDLEEENRVFEEQGVEAYYEYQLQKQNELLKKGTGYRLVDNLLKINKLFNEKQVEVIILSKNNASLSLRIMKSIHHYGLDIERSGWTSGEDTSKYLNAFDVDLFLSANEKDVKNAILSGVAAAKILPSHYKDKKSNEVRIAFDGDAVLFGEESEKIYKSKGLQAFIEHEIKNRNNPLNKGPFAKLLLTISNIQKKLKNPPIRTALITARSAPTDERVIKTLNIWGVRVDEAFFLGGSEKSKILQAFGADIFFDDQDVHLTTASKVVPSAKVVTDYS